MCVLRKRMNSAPAILPITWLSRKHLCATVHLALSRRKGRAFWRAPNKAGSLSPLNRHGAVGDSLMGHCLAQADTHQNCRDLNRPPSAAVVLPKIAGEQWESQRRRGTRRDTKSIRSWKWAFPCVGVSLSLARQLRASPYKRNTSFPKTTVVRRASAPVQQSLSVLHYHTFVSKFVISSW